MAEIEYADQRTEHPETKHEGSDVSLRWILGFAISLIVAAIIIHVVLWWIFIDYLREPPPTGRPVSVLAEGERPQFPPEPQIEGLQPAYEIPKYQAAEEFRRWNRYGWVDRERGIVRVPIDVAMEIVAEELPDRPPEKLGRPGDVWDLPDDANSGRILGADRP